jgi:hypothetical protein
MKRAPREAYDDREMKFLGSAADFQTMCQPVYLPILREFALKGDVDALPSLAQMESLEANEVLVAGLVQALDNDDWDTARTFYLSLHSCLPFPNWYDEENGAHDKSNRERVARTWKAEFGPVLTRLARRLGAEVALELRRVRIEANSAPGLEQLLLGRAGESGRAL